MLLHRFLLHIEVGLGLILSWEREWKQRTEIVFFFPTGHLFSSSFFPLLSILCPVFLSKSFCFLYQNTRANFLTQFLLTISILEKPVGKLATAIFSKDAEWFVFVAHGLDGVISALMIPHLKKLFENLVDLHLDED